jgi:hypothetical protein
MKKFLKNILARNTDSIDQEVVNNPSSKGPGISNATITTNNGCETIFEGNYTITQGNTGTVTGVLVSGIGGNSSSVVNGSNMILGTELKTAGTYFYSVSLSNSNSLNNPSSYTLTITQSNGKTATKLFQRTVFNSAFYDKQPC